MDAGATNAVANAVRKKRPQRRNISKNTRIAGRKAGRSGTIVPNNVPTTPEDAANVVAVVASLFEISSSRTAEANKITTGDRRRVLMRLVVRAV